MSRLSATWTQAARVIASRLPIFYSLDRLFEGRIITPLTQLATLIEQESDVLLARWRAELKELESARHLDMPTLNDHIPNLLVELSTALQSSSEDFVAEASIGTPPAHGVQRLFDGFEIEEVVAEYNILRICIHNMATEKNITLQGKPFIILNNVLDAAIGAAVKTYADERALEIHQKREEYLSFVAHDLRTPLNAIALATRVLELTVSNPGEQSRLKKLLHTLHRNTRHLSSLVDKILEENEHTETRLGIKLERRVLDLWPLVENLIQDLQPVAGPNRTELINDVPDEFEVYADAGLLQRIFQNLLANAIRYTPAGTVTISACRPIDRRSIECIIRDTGVGIAEERLDKIFDKFEGDTENESSAGLGLAIFKTFVEAHGGEIFIESKLGFGSVIRFTLPDKPL